MAASWLIGLVFLAVNVLMVVVLVISNSDFCASVFETQTGKLKSVTLWNRFENFVASLGANKIPLFNVVWSRVDGSLLHLFIIRHFKNHFPSPTISDVKLTTFITFFTSDDSCLYQIVILQASLLISLS